MLRLLFMLFVLYFFAGRLPPTESQETIPGSAAELAGFCVRPPTALELSSGDESEVFGHDDDDVLVDAPGQDEMVDDEVPVPPKNGGDDGGAPDPPIAPASPVDPGPTPPDQDQASGAGATVNVNSRSYPAEYAKFSRFGNNAKKLAKFPEMQKMWVSGRKDQLFKQWVANQGDPDAIECKLTVTASQKKEGECKWELLTIAQMHARGFSQFLGYLVVLNKTDMKCTWQTYCSINLLFIRPKIESVVRRGGGVVDADCPTSMEDIAYWVITSRTRTETESMTRSAELNAQVSAQDAMGVLTGSDERIGQLTGLAMDPSQAPATGELLKFVKDSVTIPDAGPTCLYL